MTRSSQAWLCQLKCQCSLAVGNDEIIEGFFELDTGDGNDVIKVNDVSQGITLDLGAASGHTKLVMTDVVAMTALLALQTIRSNLPSTKPTSNSYSTCC